jgi:hypothetical protein
VLEDCERDAEARSDAERARSQLSVAQAALEDAREDADAQRLALAEARGEAGALSEERVTLLAELGAARQQVRYQGDLSLALSLTHTHLLPTPFYTLRSLPSFIY